MGSGMIREQLVLRIRSQFLAAIGLVTVFGFATSAESAPLTLAPDTASLFMVASVPATDLDTNIVELLSGMRGVQIIIAVPIPLVYNSNFERDFIAASGLGFGAGGMSQMQLAMLPMPPGMRPFRGSALATEILRPAGPRPGGRFVPTPEPGAAACFAVGFLLVATQLRGRGNSRA